METLIFTYSIVGFLIGSATIGTLAVKLVKKSSRRYIVAGKSLPLFFIGTMLTAQSIDGNSSLGNAALTYQFGFWAGAALPIGLGICLILTGAFFAKKLNRLNLITLPDYYFRRYSNITEVMTSILMAISFIILIAGNLAATGFILSAIIGIDFFWSMLIGTLIILLYTYMGGLFSSAYTDIFQIYLAIIGFWGGFIFLSLYGPIPWSQIISNTPPQFIDLSGVYDVSNGALVFWASILALGLGDIVALDFMERVFAANSPKTAARGAWIGGALTLLTVVPTSFIGIIALTYEPNIENAYTVYPIMAIKHVPVYIGVMMIVGVLGASMSTANGGALAIASVFSRNIVQGNILKLFGKTLSDKQLLLPTRLFVVAMMSVAFIIGYLIPQPGIYLVLAFDVVFAGCFVPLVAGLYWKKSNSAGAIASIVVGSSLRLLLYFIIPPELAGLDTIIPPVISAIIFFIVCIKTLHKYKPNHDINYIIPSNEDSISRTEPEKWTNHKDIRKEDIDE